MEGRAARNKKIFIREEKQGGLCAIRQGLGEKGTEGGRKPQQKQS